jgi:hypothetical protein
LNFGYGVVQTYGKNNRMQPSEFTIKQVLNGVLGTAFHKTYNYTSSCQSANNSNIMQIIDSVNANYSQAHQHLQISQMRGPITMATIR